MKNRRGFTLIELLVVISIIAMLLAILMPALGKVKEKAKSVVCRTNLKQTAFACTMYSDDYNGKLFSYESGLYIDLLMPYMGDQDKARYCPSVIVKDDTVYTSSQAGYSKKPWVWVYRDSSNNLVQEYGTYAINGWLYTDVMMSNGEWQIGGKPGSAGRWAPQQRLGYTSLNKVKQQSETPFFCDSVWVDQWPTSDGTKTDYVPDDGTFSLDTGGRGGDPAYNHIQRSVINRHGDNINFAFVDGHVDGTSLSEQWELNWHRGWVKKTDWRRGPNGDGSSIYGGGR